MDIGEFHFVTKRFRATDHHETLPAEKALAVGSDECAACLLWRTTKMCRRVSCRRIAFHTPRRDPDHRGARAISITLFAGMSSTVTVRPDKRSSTQPRSL